MEYEKKYSEFQEALNHLEQHMFPIVLIFGLSLQKQYNDLKINYTEEHEKLFIKNIDFVLSKIK